MSIRLRTLVPLFASALCATAWSAEIIVAPGTGTLNLAVAGAAVSADTLLLQDGGYYGAVTVNKSITIRPLNRATNALVGGPVTIDGTGIKVTLQGLKFSGNVNLTRAAAIRLLENEWTAGYINGNYYRSSEGDGSLVIVGNRFAAGSSIRYINSDGAVIAGNVLSNGNIVTNAYSWIIGNQVRYINEFVEPNAIEAGASGSNVFILGNRVQCSAEYYLSHGCIFAGSPFSLIAGNLVEITDTDDYLGTQYGIFTADTSSESIILNNVVRGTSTAATRLGSAIAVYAEGTQVAGNIVMDWVSNSGTPIYVDSFDAEVTHNLCHNNTGACPAGVGNLNADPEFVDLVDFELGVGSPAIDAGPPDDGLADLDRTRNDMGVHGGPWDIAQYDVQRDSSTLAPYVYPLFKASGYLSGGLLEVKALGVARLR